MNPDSLLRPSYIAYFRDFSGLRSPFWIAALVLSVLFHACVVWQAAHYTPPPPEAQLLIAINHYTDMLELYGEGLGVRVARKHLAAYIDAAPVAIGAAERRAVRSRLCAIWAPEKIVEALTAFWRGETAPALELAA